MKIMFFNEEAIITTNIIMFNIELKKSEKLSKVVAIILAFLSKNDKIFNKKKKSKLFFYFRQSILVALKC